MTIGDKIRGIRDLKKLSIENMAEMMGLSVLAYGEIERGKTDIKMSRLEQIAQKLGVSVAKILGFEETVSNFFENCNQTNVVTGQNGDQTYYNDHKDLLHKLEKVELQLKNAELQIENLTIKLEKAESEANYLKQKLETLSGVGGL